ncbi:MAG: phage tail protein [Pseudomonadota bacterium]
MTEVMMMLGAYPFMLDTAAYQSLARVSTYRWQAQDRMGRKPAQQFLGSGADQITLQGEILPHWRGGHGQIAQMRASAAQGQPLIMLEAHGGYVLGDWVIKRIEETQTELGVGGAPHHIAFSMTLEEYGDDDGGIDGLALGLAAIRT